jgi:diguanylate cyclase (GGDEF)-like protein
VARKSGDEFLVILRGVESAAAARDPAPRIARTVGAPVTYQDRTLSVGASIGVALFPDHALAADDMIRAGDGAMYEAKRKGSNQVRMAAPAARQASA